MNRRDVLRLKLFGVTFGVLAALLIWPPSRWMVRAQMAALAPGHVSAASWPQGLSRPATPAYAASSQAVHRVAAEAPDDYELQLADALTAPSLNPRIKIARLRDIARRSPDRPSIYANLLRFETAGPVRVHRIELVDMAAPLPSPEPFTAGTPELADLASFDRDAAAGERLDPDNAYFSLLRAVGLFANHQDAEALLALHRAASKPQWTEYYSDEVDGEWKLLDTTFGESGALPRMALAAAVLLPQYSQMRAVARLAVFQAMREEQAGHIDRGIAIRDDMLRIGGLVRAESRTLIGSLVGSAISMLALQRPLGVAYLVAPAMDKVGAEHAWMRAHLIAQYDGFLQHVGHPEFSTRAHAEVAATAQVEEIGFRNILDTHYASTILQLGLGWWAGTQLLCAALWTLALGGAAMLLYRIRRLRAGQQLPVWASRGAGLGVIAALFSGVIVVPAATPPPMLCVASMLGFGLLAVALPGLSTADRRRTLGAYMLGLAAMCAFLVLFAVHAPAAGDPVRRLALDLYGMSTQQEHGSSTKFEMLFLGTPTADLIYHMIAVFVTAAAPLLAALSFALISRISGVPLSVALIRGFRGCAVPIACALLLVYAVLLPITLRIDSSANDAVRETVRHEGRYYAALEGKEWPGRLP